MTTETKEQAEKYKCLECGEEVEVKQKHTYKDCLIHKEKLKMVELSRLQDKINKGLGKIII